MMATVTKFDHRAWQDAVQISSSGSIRSNLYNACLAFREAPEFRDAVMWNEMAIRPVIRRELPWSEETDRYWTAHDDNKLNEWYQAHDLNVGIQITQQAVETVAYESKYHPVREYLEGLEWDGEKRIDGWLTYYLGVDRTRYSEAVGKAWLISAIARVLRPGCKADHVLILEGPQGLKKSTALKALAGADLFTDEIADFGSKDAAMQMRGVWIIELAELDHLGRGESARIKAFLTRTTDRFRPPYGARLIESPRECVFCGSVNHEEYLKDETGNRRFWPVRCGQNLDVDAIERDRDQLWAEALHEYRFGAVWWLDDRGLTDAAKAEQVKRVEVDAWDDAIFEFVQKQMFPQTTREILCDGLGIKIGDIKKSDEMRVSKIMKTAGYRRDSGHSDRNSLKVWWPPEPVDKDDL